MKVFPIENNKFITPKTTGYFAAGAMAVTLISGYGNNNLRKMHKPMAYSAAVLTLAHIGLTEYLYHKYKNSINKSV